LRPPTITRRLTEHVAISIRSPLCGHACAAASRAYRAPLIRASQTAATERADRPWITGAVDLWFAKVESQRSDMGLDVVLHELRNVTLITNRKVGKFAGKEAVTLSPGPAPDTSASHSSNGSGSGRSETHAGAPLRIAAQEEVYKHNLPHKAPLTIRVRSASDSSSPACSKAVRLGCCDTAGSCKHMRTLAPAGASAARYATPAGVQGSGLTMWKVQLTAVSPAAAPPRPRPPRRRHRRRAPPLLHRNRHLPQHCGPPNTAPRQRKRGQQGKLGPASVLMVLYDQVVGRAGAGLHVFKVPQNASGAQSGAIIAGSLRAN
jgi:hypothetical protein